jgi:selenocysteine-specific elongation factor
VIVGTRHIDHGKTASEGADRRRRSAQGREARGITIDLGYAAIWATAASSASSACRAERFVHNMLAGATGIDAALLVVSPPGAQTADHRAPAVVDLLGLDRHRGADQADLANDDRILGNGRVERCSRRPRSRARRSCRSRRSPGKASPS